LIARWLQWCFIKNILIPTCPKERSENNFLVHDIYRFQNEAGEGGGAWRWGRGCGLLRVGEDWGGGGGGWGKTTKNPKKLGSNEAWQIIINTKNKPTISKNNAKKQNKNHSQKKTKQKKKNKPDRHVRRDKRSTSLLTTGIRTRSSLREDAAHVSKRGPMKITEQPWQRDNPVPEKHPSDGGGSAPQRDDQERPEPLPVAIGSTAPSSPAVSRCSRAHGWRRRSSSNTGPAMATRAATSWPARSSRRTYNLTLVTGRQPRRRKDRRWWQPQTTEEAEQTKRSMAADYERSHLSPNPKSRNKTTTQTMN